MADNVLPFVIRMGALSPNFQGTPQELADAIAERLEILSQNQFAIFTRGAVEPASDVGPWMDETSTIGLWKAYNYVTGRYEPMALDPLSLGYIFDDTAPDHEKYKLWIALNGSGKATGIKTWFSGAWHDIYEDALASVDSAVAGVNSALSNYSTTAAMNAAISAAIAGIPPSGGGGSGAGTFRAEGQNQVVSGSGSVVVALGGEVFDPDNCFSGDVFTAPSSGWYHFDAYFHSETNSGSPTSWGPVVYIRRNGGGNLPASPGNPLIFGSLILPLCGNIYLDAGDTVDLWVQFTIGGGATMKIGGMLSGFKYRD